jgi:uncharacterized membrane protein SpoIIM required for sporulation
MADNISNIGILLSRLSPLIFFQNVRVLALMALLGIFTLGVSDVLIFVLPWALIGFLGGQLSLAGENPFTFFAVAILPHATVELPALLLGTAAILRWHTTVMAPPPDRTVSESWLLGAADFGRILVGLVIPLLIISALIEAHITPNILSQVYGGG